MNNLMKNMLRSSSMKNKLTFVMSSIFCLAGFAAAQEAPAAAPAAAAPVEASAPAEPAPAPAPAVEQAAQPASDSEAAAPETQAEQSQEAAPVVFYYANTVQPQQAEPQQQNTVVTPAPQPAPVQMVAPPKEEVFPKQTVHYGIQASIGTAEYIGGDTENLDDGLTWNAGAFITLPLSDYFFNVELGAQFIYRKVSASYTYENRVTRRDEARKDKVTSYTLGFPFLVNINAGKSGLINFSVGLEVETPLYNHLVISTNGKKGTDIDIANVKENDANYCEPISVDFVFGIGINATKNFGIYTRINAGITEIYDDVYLDPETRDINDQDREKGEYWSFTALDIAFGFRLYL